MNYYGNQDINNNYDKRGNIVAINAKEVFMDYNLLNLPSQIKHYYEPEGSTTDYVYLTDGRKLTANFNGGEGLEYLGSFVYLRNGQGGLSLESTDFAAGRIENSTTGYKVNYHITDHLSSVRAIATSTGAGTPPTITSRMDYHPFGTPHASSPLPTADQKHRYTFCGKEEQRIVTTIPAQYKLAVMDQGARYYIPSTMQFTSQDPLAIKYPHISPYTYCAANPILYIDPTGEEIRATTSSAQVIILNTLNSADLQYVKFNNDGAINKDVINSHSSNSGNFQSLKEIVNSEHMVDVSVANSFTYKTENGDIKIREMGTMQVDNEFDGGSYGLSTKEVGFSGIAQTPGESANKYNSTDNEVRITINSTASIAGQSQILAHELYGHAYLFVKGQEHKHIQFNMTEQNKQLYYKIINSVLETIMNMRK